MLAGPLDRRMTWQTSTPAADSLGGDASTFADAFTTWARKLEFRGQYIVQNQEDAKEASVTLQIRWRDSLSGLDRFQFEGRTYRVISITEIGRKEGLEIVGATRIDTYQVPG